MVYSVALCIVLCKICLMVFTFFGGIIYGNNFTVGIGVGAAISTVLSILLWMSFATDFERTVRKY